MEPERLSYRISLCGGVCHKKIVVSLIAPPIKCNVVDRSADQKPLFLILPLHKTQSTHSLPLSLNTHAVKQIVEFSCPAT